MARACAAVASVVTAGAGCELTQATLTETADQLVVEAYVQVGALNRLSVLVHGSIPGQPIPGLEVTVTRQTGDVIGFDEVGLVNCVLGRLPDDFQARCLIADFEGQELVRPLDTLTLSVRVDDGRRLSGQAVVPGPFSLIGPVGDAESCTLPPDSEVEVSWTRSLGAWAYVAETSIEGLPDALRPRGIEIDVDPLVLLGLAVSADDTTIVFPREFGVFERFGDEREALVAIQNGLPAGSGPARIIVAAADRNYVNWQRGGDFNPSGQIRVPSVVGDGTGVFGTLVRKSFQVEVGDRPQTSLACAIGGT